MMAVRNCAGARSDCNQLQVICSYRGTTGGSTGVRDRFTFETRAISVSPGTLGFHPSVKAKGETMRRDYRIFAPIIVALVALGGAATPGAQAIPVLTATTSPVSVSGTGEKIGDRFITDGVTTECEVSHFTGTATNGSSEIGLSPTYTSCTFAGTGIAAHVEFFSGCKWTKKYKEYFGLVFVVDVSLDCSNGALLKIYSTSGTCELTMKSQGPLSNAEDTNGSGDLKTKFNVKGLKFNVTKDGFLCPFSGTGEKTGGEYRTTSTVTLSPASGTLQASGE